MSRAGLAGVVVTASVSGVCGCAASAKGPEGAEQGPAAAPSTSAGTPAAARKKRRPVAVPRIPAGVRAGYVVYDRRAGKVTVQHNAHGTVRSASVVKILIAVDYLEGRGPGRAIPAGDQALLQSMLRSSDDGAATAFWARGGKGAIITRMVRRLGLADTAPPPISKPGFWGYTAISAADIVKTYRYLFERAHPKVRAFVLGQLHKATQCGKDRFDQYFGIPRAVPRPWAAKQGWSGFGDVPAVPCRGASTNGLSIRPAAGPDLGLGRPVLHTTGAVGAGDRRIVVVLTLQPAGSSFQAASARLTALTKQVYRAGGG